MTKHLIFFSLPQSIYTINNYVGEAKKKSIVKFIHVKLTNDIKSN